MNIEYLRDYCLSKKAVTESFPFNETTLVFKVANKMFALSGLDNIPFKVNLKCNPERAIALREKYPCIQPGYHMNKQLWNTVSPTEGLSLALFTELIDHSYDLIVARLPKKTRLTFGFS